MTAITFLGSSKPFIIPDEGFLGLWVNEVDLDAWGELLEGLYTLPYIYEISGADTSAFLLYLEKYLEVGDVLELIHCPSQKDFERYRRRLIDDPELIVINVGRFTYQNKYGTYQLNPQKWVEELSHKIYLTEHGITSIVKY